MNYFEMWYGDKTSILETMYRNLKSDLEAGYNPKGKIIREQYEMIEKYQNALDKAIENFKYMEDEKAINRWCKYDLIQRGAITI